jgi:predicted SAM-dependent methyltransferase
MRWQQLKSRLATPTMRRLLRRPDHLAVREEIARRFLHGDGIEVGALNNPLRLPHVSIRYIDCATLDALRAGGYSDVATIHQPDIIADLESLDGIDDRSVDFVIANHVLEHLENPLRALATMSRVLRSGGVAFIALPEKHYTFDRNRSVTPLWHIVRDFQEGPQWSRHDHYLDYVANVERSRDVAERVAEYERIKQNIHFHVWDLAAMQAMFDYAGAHHQIGLHIVHRQQTRGEVVWVLAKRS